MNSWKTLSQTPRQFNIYIRPEYGGVAVGGGLVSGADHVMSRLCVELATQSKATVA